MQLRWCCDGRVAALVPVDDKLGQDDSQVELLAESTRCALCAGSRDLVVLHCSACNGRDEVYNSREWQNKVPHPLQTVSEGCSTSCYPLFSSVCWADCDSSVLVCCASTEWSCSTQTHSISSGLLTFLCSSQLKRDPQVHTVSLVYITIYVPAHFVFFCPKILLKVLTIHLRLPILTTLVTWTTNQPKWWASTMTWYSMGWSWGAGPSAYTRHTSRSDCCVRCSRWTHKCLPTC